MAKWAGAFKNTMFNIGEKDGMDSLPLQGVVG